jgi:hypothetical protein
MYQNISTYLIWSLAKSFCSIFLLCLFLFSHEEVQQVHCLAVSVDLFIHFVTNVTWDTYNLFWFNPKIIYFYADIFFHTNQGKRCCGWHIAWRSCLVCNCTFQTFVRTCNYVLKISTMLPISHLWSHCIILNMGKRTVEFLTSSFKLLISY